MSAITVTRRLIGLLAAALALTILATLPAPAGAAASTKATAAKAAKSAKSAKGSSSSKRVVATYRLNRVRAKAGKIRSARLRSARSRSKSLPVRTVRRAARRGVLKVTVPPSLIRPAAPAPAAPAAPAAAPAAPAAPDLQVNVGDKVVTVPAEPAASAPKPAAPAPAVAATPAPKPSGACGFGSFGVGNWPGACWRPYSDASPFNRKLPASPRLVANSNAMVQRALGFGPIQHLRANVAGTTQDWGDVTYWPTSNDPEFTLHCVENWGTCSIEGQRVRVPAQAVPAGGSDGHMTIVDQQTGWEYDVWNVKSRANGVMTVGWGGRTRIDGDGLGSDGTAAKFGNMAGKIRPEEMEAGRIDHALFIAMGCDNGTYVYPAQKVGLSCAQDGKSMADAPPMGSHFMLDMTPAQIDALSVPAWKKTILRALAEYGAFFGDTGGSIAFAEESGLTQKAFGHEDKWVRFAKANSVPYYAPDDVWVFNIRDGVDWQSHLKVVAPCVSQGTC